MAGYLSEILRLFLPERCAACGDILPEGLRLFCPRCQWEMPQTGYCSLHDNPVYHLFDGLLPVVEASSWLLFLPQSRSRNLIHSFKYRGQWRISRQLGHSMGEALREGGLYSGVDLVVPVPLHPLRRLWRGYNQAEYLAEGVAHALGKPLCTQGVARSRHNPPQVSTHAHNERWSNVQAIFTVRHPQLLEGRHILLIDDVLTTGATLVSCAETILQASPGSRVSIATLAVSSRELSHRGL